MAVPLTYDQWLRTLQQVPQGMVKPISAVDPNYASWERHLQVHINNILKATIADTATRFAFIGRDAMNVWSRAFKYFSFSPEDNYEKLEFLGDAVLKGIFPKYLLQVLPDLDEAAYSNLNTYYMSKIRQALLADDLGLPIYLLVPGLNGDIIDKLKTDVFESFFGALETVAEMVQPGTGFFRAYNMLIYLFRNIPLTANRAHYAAPRTAVEQTFSRLGLGKPDLTTNIGAFDVAATVTINQRQEQFLASRGIYLSSLILARIVAPTEKEAISESFRIARDTLFDAGATTEWVDEQHRLQDLNLDLVRPWLPAATARATQEGLSHFRFAVPSKTETKTGAVVILIANGANGKARILGTTYEPTNNLRQRDWHLAYARLMQAYAEGQ